MFVRKRERERGGGKAMEQAQEKKPGKNMLWGGRFTGSFTLEKL